MPKPLAETCSDCGRLHIYPLGAHTRAMHRPDIADPALVAIIETRAREIPPEEWVLATGYLSPAFEDLMWAAAGQLDYPPTGAGPRPPVSQLQLVSPVQ